MSFLSLVARAFIEHHASELHDFCFVFPNRRSSVFFIEQLSQIANRTMLSPCVTNITDFLSELTDSVEPSKTEQLFILYQEYCRIMGERAEPFDRFSYWGDIILNDFNDVDKYLADPQRIFRNIRDLKNIRSNFLTDEQAKVIREYFGVDYNLDLTDDKFWRDPKVYDSSSSRHFMDIWEALYPLYQAFNVRLGKQHFSYSGRIYREAVTRINEMRASDFRYRQYVFVGFNVLSLSEIKIFKALGNKDIADYYWDCNSPALRHKDNKASWFISKNIAMFPSKLDINEPQIDSFPPITVLGIPSGVGQAKHTHKILDELIDSGAISSPDNAINTAIVLPDEALFMPLLDSLNERISGVNITMGYPLRLSEIAVFVNRIARLHKQSRKSGNDFIFFHEDVKDLISHPYMRLINEAQCTALSSYMAASGRFYVTFTKICEICLGAGGDSNKESLTEIFSPVPATYTSSMLVEFLNRIVRIVERGLIAGNAMAPESVAMGMISQFMDRLSQLSGTILKYDIEMNENTFFYLVGRMVASIAVAFEGEPLHGLQIMGVLETRCLDFDNVIILSMNERVFPRKHYSRSFIPANLRRGFGMATVEFQDCMYAYYFYRLISRAKSVHLLYDARRQAIGSGEYSRYIGQLRTIYRDAKVDHRVLDFTISAPGELKVDVEKNERIMQRILRYTIPGSGYYLSASSINQYINCPLSFYFEKVEDLKIADDVNEFMDASTIGTIVHDVLKDLYNRPGIITPNTIAGLRRLIPGTVKHYIGKHYTNGSEETTGETEIISRAIEYFVKSVLSFDSQQGDFRFVMGETEQTTHWNGVNIRQYIDRVDKIIASDGSERLRIIDYKTGSDRTSASSVADMFEDKSNKRCKAMLQLMLYCNVFAHDRQLGDTPIQPIIYKVTKMAESGFSIDKQTVENYLAPGVNDVFISRFKAIIEELCNPSVPFRQTTNTYHCSHCKFTPFCHR